MRALTGLSLLLLLAACDHAAEGAKEALNKGGELAGKAQAKCSRG